MPEQAAHPAKSLPEVRQAVRIHTRQIEDACIDKDCIEELRVYLTEPGPGPGAQSSCTST